MFDAHCHAWHQWPYDSTVPDPATRGSAESLLRQMDAAGVEKAAIVCARIGGGAGGQGFANPDNNQYVSQFDAAHPDRLTAWIDLDCSWHRDYHTPGAAARLMTGLTEAVSGFTHYCKTENDQWFHSDEADELFATAAAHNLVASLSLQPAWLPDLMTLAARHPSLPILLHHLGIPRTPAEADLVMAAAARPSIGVKISGFHYNWPDRTAFPFDGLRTYCHRLITTYGPQRLFWGSDWPAGRDYLTYQQSIDVARIHTTVLPPAAQAAILGGNLEELMRTRRMPSESTEQER